MYNNSWLDENIIGWMIATRSDRYPEWNYIFLPKKDLDGNEKMHYYFVAGENQGKRFEVEKYVSLWMQDFKDNKLFVTDAHVFPVFTPRS